MTTLFSIPLYKSNSLNRLSRINNNIYGFDTETDSFIEVDLKHSIVWQHSIPETSFTPLIECKYTDSCLIAQDFKEEAAKQGYICVFNKSLHLYSFHDKQIHTFSSHNSPILNKKPSSILLTSNSMADFTHCIDTYQHTMIFTKLHENHLKFSINWVQGSEKQKKIVKLLDHNPKSIHINRHLSQQVIYTDEQSQAKYFDLNKPQAQTLLAKKSILIFDSNFLFCTSSNLVSKFNDVYEIQTIDLKTGKYAFTFKGNGMPKKIQSYGNFVFYSTNSAFEIYDKRKGDVMWRIGLHQEQNKVRNNEGFDSLRDFGRYAERRVNDFMVEPNLGRIYLSLSNELRVLDFCFF